MIWLLSSLAYSAVGIGLACRIASHLAWSWAIIDAKRYPSLQRSRRYDPVRGWVTDEVDPPSGDKWVGAMSLGLLAACVWPVIILGWTARSFLFAPPKDIMQARKAAEFKRQQEAAAAELADLDRQLAQGRKQLKRR